VLTADPVPNGEERSSGGQSQLAEKSPEQLLPLHHSPQEGPGVGSVQKSKAVPEFETCK